MGPIAGTQEVAVAATAKGSKDAQAGAETRDRLIEACRSCLRAEGIAGVSARAIARHGDLNQALVFYHFGSVDGLLAATAREDSQRRAALYAERLAEVDTLAQLVAVGRAIHDEETKRGSTVVLTQLLAGSISSPDLRDAVMAGMDPWTELVEQALARVIAGTPLASAVPTGDIAFAISSLFLGMELMAGHNPDAERVDSLFGSLDAIGAFVDALLPKGSA
ncbi:MAG: TetR/AcrR family transcriptional regulator [Acidimicrobiales bacterium]